MKFEDVKRIRENPTAENVENAELHKMIDLAIEKQIPKKPIKTPDYHKWFCPTCHNPIRLGRNHCCNCGQKIGYGSDTE